MIDSILEQLNDAQRQAAKEINGPVLVLAGAGSGKTRVLTNRIVYMVENGVNPLNILAITFTNKAANEMKERLGRMNCNSQLMTISTIHSLCSRILRRDATRLGYDTNFSIYDDQDTAKVLKDIFKRRNIEDDKLKKQVARHISIAKTYAMSPNEYRREAQGTDIDIICNIFAEYNKILLASNAMDFDDLLLNVHRLFKEFPDVLDFYQKRFVYISIDEFQDVNKVQYDIFRMLAAKNRNLFVVGDDDQSIYGWRGADVTNILNFSDDYPEAKVFKLEQNYRSTKKILDVANEIISHNLSRHDKKLWTGKDGGVKVETFAAFTENEEAAFVIQQIIALSRYSGHKYSDFAVLMRINALSRVFEQECLKYGIPFRVFGGFKFFERKEIKDLTAYLRVIANSFDNEAVLRIINTPKRGIGETTQSKLRELSIDGGMSIIELLSDPDNLECFNGGTRIKLNGFYDVFRQLKKAGDELTLGDLVKKTVEITHFRESVMSSDEDVEKNMNIDQFVQSAEEYERDNEGATLTDFLQSVSLSPELNAEDENNCVTLATVHSAKGLEFDTVFVVGLDEGIMPISRAMYDNKEMEEERRLMYVAVTRAKQRLYLTRAKSRFLYNERSGTVASRFFNEVVELTAPPKQNRYDADGVPAFDTPIKTVSQPKKTIDTSAYRVGNVVKHTTFGKGLILNINNGNADIIFDAVGKKTLALKYAPLEIIK